MVRGPCWNFVCRYKKRGRKISDALWRKETRDATGDASVRFGLARAALGVKLSQQTW